MPDKNEEKQIGEFFLGYLNRRYGYDYIAELNNEESGENFYIDVYAKSSSDKYPSFNLQIVTSNGKLKQESALLRNIAKKTGQNIVMGPVLDTPFEKWISSEIKRKESKYSEEIKKCLVLLVKFDISLFNENWAKAVFENLGTSNFLGIYAVNLPKTTELSTHPHDGQIIAIKSIPTIRELIEK